MHLSGEVEKAEGSNRLSLLVFRTANPMSISWYAGLKIG